MLHRSATIAGAFAALLLSVLPAGWAWAQMACAGLEYGNPQYHENMDELAARAGLPDNAWSRHHESVVRSLCRGDLAGVDTLVDAGSVSPREAQGIARVLGTRYAAKPRSDAGKRYGSARQRLLAMGACSACADNIAQHYAKTPASRCGLLAKRALEGNPDAIEAVVAFPDYCQWKY